jgi:hypothetical protein
VSARRSVTEPRELPGLTSLGATRCRSMPATEPCGAILTRPPGHQCPLFLLRIKAVDDPRRAADAGQTLLVGCLVSRLDRPSVPDSLIFEG